MQHSEAFTVDKEEQIWQKGALGVETARSLLNAVFYLNGRNLCLRGRMEHRNLKLSQLQFASNETGDYVVYIKNVYHIIIVVAIKTNMKHYSDPDQQERCYVNVLKTSFGKLPEAAFQQDVFYWRSKSKVEDKDYHLPLFEERVIEKLVLGNMVKNMVKESGLSCTNKTNHSLRATGATHMFEANVPKKLVKEQTRHRSSKSLEVYQKRQLLEFSTPPKSMLKYCKVRTKHREQKRKIKGMNAFHFSQFNVIMYLTCMR